MRLAAIVLSVVIASPLASTSWAQQCCTGNVSPYCTAGTSVQGCSPAIRGEGVPDTARANGFNIVVGEVPGQRMGLIFYGMTPIAQPQPWGLGSSSYLCIYYPVARTGAQSSGAAIGSCSGELRVDFNSFMTLDPGALGGPFTAGQQFCAQGWYRDPGAAKGTNLSDGLRFNLCLNAGDTTPPVISSCAANQTVPADANCQGIVPDFTVGVIASDNCTPVTISQTPAPGAAVPIGSNPITISVTDGTGNVTQCSATLDVIDIAGPVISSCAPNQVVQGNSSCQAAVPDFVASVVAVDTCGGVVLVSQTPSAGTLTYVGITPISIVAIDGFGNASNCAANLTVLPSAQCAPPSGFVPVVPGSFQMGEVWVAEPVHTVTISYPFWIASCEVTQAEYTALMGSNPSQFLGNVNRPVERVSWNAARTYCSILTSQHAGSLPSGYEFRLPTEAEWEYACRAGTATSWNVGASLSCPLANHRSGTPCVGLTAPVGSYAPNAWGLHDMHGNVQEWCLDSLAGYAAGAVTDPFVPGPPTAYRVLRGGSWAFFAPGCRSAYRTDTDPSLTSDGVGFRVVLAPIRVP